MAFEIKKLPYDLGALAPRISEETLQYHYGKHTAAYFNNLNGLIAGTPFENSPLEEIIAKADGAIFNNAAQAWNHTFYFSQFSPSPKTAPEGALAEAINASFGSFEQFKADFLVAAGKLFGSGWVWLSKDSTGKLVITSESNAGNPLRAGLTPLMTLDVWEHAYYIDYRNRRPDAVTAHWELIDWGIIGSRFK